MAVAKSADAKSAKTTKSTSKTKVDPILKQLLEAGA
ncbi:MAG: hypothetical protein QG675_686, partial [Patescibacteria group bacterium]|nr:hypothetical protein [Patescibacteria group bacterium]